MANIEELKATIEDLKKQIQEQEMQRLRSMAAIVNALVDKVEPDEKELGFFRMANEIIAKESAVLRLLQDEVEASKE